MFEPPVDPNSKSKLVAINLDTASIGRANANIEHEREVAIFDILEANSFVLEGRDDGPYTLDLSIVEDRLVFAVGHQGEGDTFTYVLSLTPLRRIMKDYFMVCESYYQAIRTAPPSRIQSTTWAGALHAEGAGRSAIARGQDRADRAPRGVCSRHLRTALEGIGVAGGGATSCRVRTCVTELVRSPMAAPSAPSGRTAAYVESRGYGPRLGRLCRSGDGGDRNRHCAAHPRTLRSSTTRLDLIVTLSPEAHTRRSTTRTMAVESICDLRCHHDDRPRPPRADRSSRDVRDALFRASKHARLECGLRVYFSAGIPPIEAQSEIRPTSGVISGLGPRASRSCCRMGEGRFAAERRRPILWHCSIGDDYNLFSERSSCV